MGHPWIKWGSSCRTFEPCWTFGTHLLKVLYFLKGKNQTFRKAFHEINKLQTQKKVHEYFQK